MGLIVNKPANEIVFGDLLEQLEIAPAAEAPDVSVHFGGPVDTGRGFVLHSPEFEGLEGSLDVGEDFRLTVTLDVVREIANRSGPKSFLFALGYAGWGPGQLEGEIAENGWLTCDATPELVFGTPSPGKWNAALQALGVNALLLSAESGRA